MAYLTLKFRNDRGDLLCESDFTLEEFIPHVRQACRTLAHEPELKANPAGYRALIKPCYDPWPEAAPQAPAWKVPAAVGRDADQGALLQISEEDIEVLAPVSLRDELDAFYNPATSTLCLGCPERQRCRGSGAAPKDLSGWIELDPEAPRSNQPVTYFGLRIETLAGRILHRSELRLGKLQMFVALTAGSLGRERRLVAGESETIRVEVVARFEGQPTLEPLFPPHRWPPAAASALPRAPALDPPRRLVDWDRLEDLDPAGQPGAPTAAASPPDAGAADLNIRIFPTETDPLPLRQPPPSRAISESNGAGESMPIYLHQAVMNEIDAQSLRLRSEAGGILIGEAFVDPSTGAPYVEVVAALPAVDERGEWSKVNLDSHLLRHIQERIDRDFPSRRTIGWYHFHLLRLAVRTNAGVVTAAGIVGEPLRLRDEEVFLHRNFFPQPWHLGLVIDTTDGGLRFYHLRGEEIVISTDCRVVE